MIDKDKFEVIDKTIEDDRLERSILVYHDDVWRKSNKEIGNAVTKLLDYLTEEEYRIIYIKIEVDKSVEIHVMRLI